MQNLFIGETRTGKLVEAIQLLIKGRNNAAGQVTLTLSQTTTTVSNPNISKSGFPQISAASSAAAAEAASVYVGAVQNGSFVITHPSNGTAGRTWNWHATGG
jgi:uncharacterized lipoprotein